MIPPTPIVTVFSTITFWLLVAIQDTASAIRPEESTTEIVLAAPIQLVLYGGDRFLAANIESVRAAVASTAANAHGFRLRAHETVSRLNPCHEDNYWIGNAALTWGGAEEQGFIVLNNAMHCRFWDEWPAFFYGFNKHFFRHSLEQAREALELAAQRSSGNAAAFRTFSIMLEAGKIDDMRLVLDMLKRERDKAKDNRFRDMLSQRVTRVENLLTLRNAQAEFEKQYGRRLQHPQELLDSGVLKQFPDDPLRIGYEFRDHTFHLRTAKPRQ